MAVMLFHNDDPGFMSWLRAVRGSLTRFPRIPPGSASGRVLATRLTLIALLAALLAGVAPAANAVVPGKNGKIAFTSSRDGNHEIYVMKADGSGQTRLTNNVADDGFPAWSPDAAKIEITPE